MAFAVRQGGRAAASSVRTYGHGCRHRVRTQLNLPDIVPADGPSAANPR